MITERTLNKWRAEALEWNKYFDEVENTWTKSVHTLHERILRLTQELLDQYLLIKTKARGAAAAERRFDKATIDLNNPKHVSG